jgi:hypothetical protein
MHKKSLLDHSTFLKNSTLFQLAFENYDFSSLELDTALR